MTVRIEHQNPPDLSESFVYSLTLTRLDVTTPQPDRDVVKFPYNPEGYSVTSSPRWTSRNEAGAFLPSHHWDGNDPVGITLALMLQQPDQSPLDKTILTLEEWALRPTDATQRPTRVLFNAGVYTKVLIMTSVDANRLRTNGRGECILCDLAIQFVENEAQL